MGDDKYCKRVIGILDTNQLSESTQIRNERSRDEVEGKKKMKAKLY